MISWGLAILVSAVSGCVAAIVTPLVVSSLEMVRWQRKRRSELRYAAFQEALKALAMYYTDCTDPVLQAERSKHNGPKRVAEMRPQTSESLEVARGLIKVFFEKSVSDAYAKAANADVRIEKAPNWQFLEARDHFTKIAAVELGILKSNQD